MQTTLASLNLSRSELKALEVCGINRLSQLAAASPEQLRRDLDAAEKLFQDANLNISIPRLHDICRAARQTQSSASSLNNRTEEEARKQHFSRPSQAEPSEAPPQPLPSYAREAKLSEKSNLTAAAPVAPAPMQAKQVSAKKESDEEFAQAAPAHRRRSKERGLDNYHAAHPVALVLASLFLLLTGAGALLLIIASFYLMMDEEPPLPALWILISCVVTGVSYLLCLTRCQCVICRGRMCSVFSNKRGRHAHYVPLLGHTIPTAFAILFTLSTICPHCNTRQSIIGGYRPSSRFHHHQH